MSSTAAVGTGEPGNETPQLARQIFRLVANPTGRAALDTQEEEIAPKGDGYLARNNMVRPEA